MTSSPLPPATEFTVDYADPQVKAVTRLALSRVFWSLSRIRVQNLGLACAILTLLIGIGFAVFGPARRWLPLLLAALFFLAMLLVQLVTVLVMFLRFVHAPGTTDPGGRVTWELSAGGLTLRRADQALNLAWTDVGEVLEHQDYFGLNVSGKRLLVVPRAALPPGGEAWLRRLPTRRV